MGDVMANRVLGHFTLFSEGLSFRRGHVAQGCISVSTGE